MKIAFSTAVALAFSLALAGAASAQPQGGHNSGMRAACAADLQTLCKDVQPGGGRIMQCLKDHKDAVSAPCKTAMMQRMSERRAAKAAGGTAGGTASPPSN